MGLFTDIAAALSFNFGGKELPDEFYDHLYERDRTEEQKKLLEFLRNKYSINCKVVEDIINTINKYTNDYDNIPYDKIMHETGYQKDDLIMGEQAIKEYLAQNENIDYAVNNITQPDGTRTDILTQMISVVAKVMANDKDFVEKVDDIAKSMDLSQSDDEYDDKQFLLDLMLDQPDVYGELRSVIKSSPDIIQPFTVNPDQTQQTHREMNEIAMEQILDPNKNAGITAEAVETAKQIMQEQGTEETEQQQTSEGDGFTMKDPEPQEEDKKK